MKNYLHLASNGLGFNESGVRFDAGVISNLLASELFLSLFS